MTISLTSHNKLATKAQVRRVRTLTSEAIEDAVQNSGFTHDQLQTIHTQGGLYKKQLTLNFQTFVRKFARKFLGMVTALKAQDTGLVPRGWTVKKDKLEGGVDLDLARLDYSMCPVPDDEEYISSDTMLKRAQEVNVLGSLSLAAHFLKAQEEGQEIFPVKSRGQHRFIMPLTELEDDDGNGWVAYFHWFGERWVLDFLLLVSDFFRDDRFVRLRE